jgi:hypothetical protein
MAVRDVSGGSSGFLAVARRAKFCILEMNIQNAFCADLYRRRFMAETTKKAKATTPKPKKAAVKKTVAEKAEAVTGIAIVKPVSQEEVAALAHRFWAERGYQHGQHVADWFRAEQELRSKAS